MNLMYSARHSVFLKKFLFWCILCFLSLYIFCLPTFGEAKSVLHYLIYFSMAFLGISCIIYILLFSQLKIKILSLFTPVLVLYSLIGTMIYSHDYKLWISLVLLCLSFYVFLMAFKAVGVSNLLRITIISISVFSVVFIVFYRKDFFDFLALFSGTKRLGYDFDNPNGVGAYESLLFACSLYLLLFSKSKWKFLYLISITLSLIVGWSTGSRTFFFSLLIFIVILLFFKFKKRKLIFFIGLSFFVISLIVVLSLPFMSGIRDRLLQSLNTLFGNGGDFDRSTFIRSIWFDYGLFLGTKNLIFGYGAGGFSIFSGLETYAHSNYVEVLCNFGIVGFLIFYGNLIFLFFLSMKVKNNTKAFVISFCIYYFIIGISTVFYYKKMYFLILAIMTSIVSEESEYKFAHRAFNVADLFGSIKSRFFRKKKPLNLMYITNNIFVSEIAERYGVDRIWIDLEKNGKEERQKGMNTVKSNHSIDDIKKIKPHLKNAKLQVRINPIYSNSEFEVNKCIEYGADYIMLPMWKTVNEVETFVRFVNRRVKTILLLETKEAYECLDEIIKIQGIDEIHIGLNDLHLSYNLKFMFELLTNGVVENICSKLKNTGIKYGFGGFSNLNDGLIPAKYIIAEHYRLKSTQAILSRGFCRIDYDSNPKGFENLFKHNMIELRAYEKKLSNWNKNDFEKNKRELYDLIDKVVAENV